MKFRNTLNIHKAIKMQTMGKSIILLGTFLLAMACGQQTRLVEDTTKDDSALIPYQKYQLPNGLTVIVHEDHSDPLVHVDVTYHVGSAREELGRSGFAHFFEHMMFQGSGHVADEQHFKIVSEAGGTLNGTTNRDRTNYYETVPSDQLERMLWLEADRMGFLLEAVTQEKFEVQRATVKNEKGQNYDNRPYGPHYELMAETLYPQGHPYSWLTIGRLEDLDRADLDDLKNFFLRWYGPNNATLTVGGDVDPEQVVALSEKYFGPIPKGPAVEPMHTDSVVLEEDRYVSYHDRNIRFPALVHAFPTVPRYHSDEPALDALSKILGQGKTSYLYKTFVETQKAVQASTSHPCSELAGEFNIFLLPYPGTSLTELKDEMDTALNAFDVESITEEQLETFKTQYEAGVVQSLGKVSGKVSQLAAFETFLGNPNQLQKELKRYRDITKADVVRVFKEYIKDRPAVVMSILAQADAQPARPDNFVLEQGDSAQTPTKRTPVETRTVQDDFDRSALPPVGEAPSIQVPEFWEGQWSNGIELIGTDTDEIPAVSIRLELHGGQLYDPAHKVGLGSLTAALLNESTEDHSASEMAAELEKLGSSISISSGDQTTVVSLWSLTKNLGPTLSLLQEKLFHPAFSASDFERLKKQAIESARASQQQPRGMASSAFGQLLYGKDHVLAPPSSGLPETLEAISLEDVQAHYNNYYAPDHSELVVVGNIKEKEIIPMLQFLKDWAPKGVSKVDIPELPTVGQTTLYVMDKPGAPQSEIRMGHPTDLRYGPTGDYYKATLLNYPLGGAFNSRINLNLREDKGYTYGAGSRFSSDRLTGVFTASASVKAEHTADAVREFLNELKTFQKEGPDPDELQFTQAAMGRREALEYETLGQKAGFLNKIITYDLDAGYKEEQRQLLQSITERELDSMAQRYIRPDGMIILVVGDMARHGDSLRDLGLPVVELDAQRTQITTPSQAK
ncbi:M16 family metallopeptidase [Flagellimonas sp. SN16]|uniref:M16 family metallopeptidase n=1 Tax=Flagellimonas sp. SN16 TaxID=3415142 RepID=UPI003C5566A2